IGLMVGSFLNVVIYRLDDLKTIISDRSHCLSCGKKIAWYDLIPIVSFILLRTRCRQCGAKISWQYPAVELGTGFMFSLLYLFRGFDLGLIFYLIIFSLLLVVFVYDLKTETVPEIFVWATLVLSLLGGWYFADLGLGSALLGALIGGGFLALLVVLSKEQWMGAGDIKIGLIMGLLTGYPGVLLSLFAAFFLGSIVGIIMIALKKRTLKQSLPFAPFLIAATLFGVLYGNYLIAIYLSNIYY
ncbi:MAG TPA: prepilin peptidase, partial [bacterium]|nr:prepilin peptidase [bacterium]